MFNTHNSSFNSYDDVGLFARQLELEVVSDGAGVVCISALQADGWQCGGQQTAHSEGSVSTCQVAGLTQSVGRVGGHRVDARLPVEFGIIIKVA